MKHKYILRTIGTFALLACLSSCNDFLDREPKSSITPEVFLTEESQLAAYAINRYGIFPTHTMASTFMNDTHTDAMAQRAYHNRYVPGQWKVGQSGGDWSFTDIFQCNYFLEQVLPRYEAGTLSGTAANIKHYIGEIYFIRAYAYFVKLQAVGDFPIITTTQPDDKAVLTEVSKRMPRNEVARFILSDLDKAIDMMLATAPDGNRNRLSKACAQLFKSRVALFEGTWLKYFKGTEFVPNGPGWPGAEKDYNAGYQFPSGSIDGEIEFFLGEAMSAAQAVADVVPLVENNGTVQQDPAAPANLYFDMFGDTDLKSYEEVLMWKKYDRGLGIENNVAVDMQHHNSGIGYTRGMVEGFLMANGLPIYAAGSGYHGDDYIADVMADRDGRLQIFMKKPGEKNILFNTNMGTHQVPVEPYPDILNLAGNNDYITGYANRKGLSYDGALCDNLHGYTACIVFRAAEAYLNYLEACYEKNGSLDAKAQEYWKKIRQRACTDDDYQKTIAATDMAQEALGDWGAYSAGQLVDATLYNIRRERRCEFMAEGFRLADLRRWRSLDQMITTPYLIEGMKIWGPMQDWYKDADGNSMITYGIGDKSNMSAPTLSVYNRVYQKTETSLAYNGYRWAMAHYLNPIAIEHFLITSSDGASVETSPIYQNPDWPTEANGVPIK